ncbi:MAG: cupin [Chloroflexi bacterium]|nr:MAG: cupin [Chloroflexota bacterium]
MELNVTPWTDAEPPTEEVLREKMVEQELTVAHWSGQPQGVIEGHTHGYHKILAVVSGSIKFEFPTRHKTITLKAGDQLELPAGLRHTATVGMDGVTCLEAHVY